MVIAKVKFYGLALMITGILFMSVFHSADVQGTILSGRDESTVNAYKEGYITAEEKNDTIVSGL